MPIALLDEPPLALPGSLGPYRAKDYANLPDSPRCELIQGNFYVPPSPAIPHQVLAFELAKRLDVPAREAGGYVFMAPLDVRLADHSIVQPDVIYVSAARRGILGDRQGWIEGAPDLLIEILSPGTARRDRVQKLDLYARSGIAEYWIVEHLLKSTKAGDVVAVLSNGGFDGLHDKLLRGLTRRAADRTAS